jgi:hypothetical protein
MSIQELFSFSILGFLEACHVGQCTKLTQCVVNPQGWFCWARLSKKFVATQLVPVLLSINVSPDRQTLLPDYETSSVVFMLQFKNSRDLYSDMISLKVTS